MYTDGSYNRKLAPKACGWAAVIVKMETAETIVVDILYGVDTSKTMESVWNVGAEISAVLYGIEHVKSQGIDDLNIFYDYNGIGAWGDGWWKTNKEATIAYRKAIKRYRQDMKIKFTKVEGHSGNLLNEMADMYAKKAIALYLDPNSEKQTQWLEKDFVIDKEYYSGQHFYF